MLRGASYSMEYSEEYLRRLCNNEIVGDFPPFNKTNSRKRKVISHIKTLVGRLKEDHHLLIDADFENYGSGYASYVYIKISKRDKSSVITTIQGSNKTDRLKGLLIYVSKLSPHWYYGGMEWIDRYHNNTYTGGYNAFLRPDSIDGLDLTQWRDPLIKIQKIMTEFSYSLLDRQSLERSLWFDVIVPTILSESPHTVFDCFFHWED
jgi:hypothetical protein